MPPSGRAGIQVFVQILLHGGFHKEDVPSGAFCQLLGAERRTHRPSVPGAKSTGLGRLPEGEAALLISAADAEKDAPVIPMSLS